MPLRKTLAAEDSRRGADDVVGRALADLDVALRLEQAQLVEEFEADVGDFVGAVGAVALQSREVDVREVVIGAAFLRRYSDFRRGRRVVDLDEEAGEQFFSLVARERAVCQSLRVERREVLVEVSGAHGVPAVEFRDGREVYEPVHLDGLPEVARRVCGDPAADVGYLEKLGLAGLVLLFGRHLLGEVGVTLGEDDDRVAGDVHALKLLVLGSRFGVVDEVELRAGFGDVLLHVESALLIDEVVQRGVAERALFAEFGEGARLIKEVPCLRHTLEELVSHAKRCSSAARAS